MNNDTLILLIAVVEFVLLLGTISKNFQLIKENRALNKHVAKYSRVQQAQSPNPEMVKRRANTKANKATTSRQPIYVGGTSRDLQKMIFP